MNLIIYKKGLPRAAFFLHIQYSWKTSHCYCSKEDRVAFLVSYESDSVMT